MSAQVIPLPVKLEHDQFFCAVQNEPWPIITTARKTVEECKSAAVADTYGKIRRVARPARYWPMLEQQGWTVRVFTLREYRPRKKKVTS